MSATATPSVERAKRGAKSERRNRDFLKKPKKLLIGGKWVSSKSGKTFETINPANEQVLALVAEGDKADVDEAVKAARKAYEEGKWSSISPHQRTRYLLKIADLIDKMRTNLRNSKPSTTANLCHSRGLSTSRHGPESSAISRAGRPRSTARQTLPIHPPSTTRCASRWAYAV